MKNEQNNRQRYHDAFDQIKLSEEGYRQIRNKEETTMIHFHKQTKKRLGFRTAVSLAALAAVFLSANAIAYAATGSTLIEQAEHHISIYINGKRYDDAKITKHKDNDGNTYYTASLDDTASPDGKGSQSTTIVMEEEIDEPEISIQTDNASNTSEASSKDKSASPEPKTATTDYSTSETTASVTHNTLSTAVKQVGDTIYLQIEGMTKKPVRVDITKDFADGSAEGTVQIKHVNYQYKVAGTVEENTIDLETSVLSH